MSTIRTRYAPSPTGLLHTGQIRSALFNYLFSKQKRGVFILRIEDTDAERSKKQFEDAIYEDLKWLGIEPDESPIHGGYHGPYRQSERSGKYKKYLEKLLSEGKAFWCDCKTEGEQQVPICNKEEHRKGKKPGGGIIRFNNPDIRFFQALDKNPDNKEKLLKSLEREFSDEVHGIIKFFPPFLGDFSIARNINAVLYNFAVVIDDYEMGISHVIRGDDHIPNTPKQIMLYEALGLKQPNYAHLPLVLAKDRSKLSKRKGAKSIAQYRDEGYLPEALINFLALLGWSPGGDREILSKDELIKEFSLERVQKSSAIFDEEKLDWMNGEYIRSKPVSELTDLCMPFWKIDAKGQNRQYLEKIIALEQPRLKKLSEIGERTDYFFTDPDYDKELLRWKKMTDDDVRQSLDKSINIISSNIEFNRNSLEKRFLDEIGSGDKGSILWPLRVALSGKKASPGPFDLMDIFGQTKTLSRLNKAKGLL